jgi:hypothetical protein
MTDHTLTFQEYTLQLLWRAVRHAIWRYMYVPFSYIVCDRSRDHAASVFSAQNNVSVRWRRRRLGHRLRQQLPGADAAAATFGPSSAAAARTHHAMQPRPRFFANFGAARAFAALIMLRPAAAARKTKSTFTVIRSAERAADRLPPIIARDSAPMEWNLRANGRRRFSPLSPCGFILGSLTRHAAMVCVRFLLASHTQRELSGLQTTLLTRQNISF